MTAGLFVLPKADVGLRRRVVATLRDEAAILA
jgi:hypothetical protein